MKKINKFFSISIIVLGASAVIWFGLSDSTVNNTVIDQFAPPHHSSSPSSSSLAVPPALEPHQTAVSPTHSFASSHSVVSNSHHEANTVPLENQRLFSGPDITESSAISAAQHIQPPQRIDYLSLTHLEKEQLTKKEQTSRGSIETLINKYNTNLSDLDMRDELQKEIASYAVAYKESVIRLAKDELYRLQSSK